MFSNNNNLFPSKEPIVKIEPKAAPSVPFIDKTWAPSKATQSGRERAIAALLGTQTPAAQAAPPVQDASAVTPEEMVGLRPQETPTTQESEQVATVDSQEATSPTPAKVEEPLSPHYAVLARKEKALRAEVAKLNAAKAAFKAEQEAKVSSPQAQAPAIDESKYISKDRLSQDYIGVLEELGYSVEDIGNRLLNRGQVDPMVNKMVSDLQAKIAKLEAAQDETRKTYESNQSDSYNQAVSAMTYEAEDLVNNDPEFATIKETGQYEEIVNLIKDVHEKGLPGKYRKGTLLSVEQAARLVEDELVNQWTEQYEKLSRIEKIQKRIKPATPDAKPGQPQGTQPQQPAATNQTKTLTNNMTTTRKMSARERAIAVMNGQKVS